MPTKHVIRESGSSFEPPMSALITVSLKKLATAGTMALEAEGDGAAIANLTIARAKASEEVNLYILWLSRRSRIDGSRSAVESWCSVYEALKFFAPPFFCTFF